MDQQLLFLLNQHWVHPAFDWFLGTLSCLAFWMPILVFSSLWLILRCGIPGRVVVLLCLTGVGVNETLIAQPLKKLTQKPRPHEALAHVRRVDLAQTTPRLFAIALPLSVSFSGEPSPIPNPKGRRSFPSAHTLNATTLGLVLAVHWRFWGWLFLPLLMAWSRVYTGAHWPSDVLAALLLGTTSTLTLLWIFHILWRRWVSVLRPEWTHPLPMLGRFFSTAGHRGN